MYSSSLTGSLKAAIDVRDGCNEAYEVLGMADKDGNYLKDADGKIINVQDITEAEYNGYVAAGYSKKMVTVGETRFNSSYKVFLIIRKRLINSSRRFRMYSMRQFRAEIRE